VEQIAAATFEVVAGAEVFEDMAVILVVEDEEQVRVLAETYLQENGYETRSAATLEEALALLADGRENIDLLFTDLKLKDNDLGGVELGRQARKLRPNLAVIYTTGGAVTDGTIKLFVPGHGFLPKPYTTDDLLSAVESLSETVKRQNRAEQKEP
jgi:two-component system, cell cycle sensor histidine kinase and response regulator CckA